MLLALRQRLECALLRESGPDQQRAVTALLRRMRSFPVDLRLLRKTAGSAASSPAPRGRLPQDPRLKSSTDDDVRAAVRQLRLSWKAAAKRALATSGLVERWVGQLQRALLLPLAPPTADARRRGPKRRRRSAAGSPALAVSPLETETAEQPTALDPAAKRRRTAAQAQAHEAVRSPEDQQRVRALASGIVRACLARNNETEAASHWARAGGGGDGPWRPRKSLPDPG